MSFRFLVTALTFGRTLKSTSNLFAFAMIDTRKTSASVKVFPKQYLPLVDAIAPSKKPNPLYVAHLPHGALCSAPKRVSTCFRIPKFCIGCVLELIISQSLLIYCLWIGSFGMSWRRSGYTSSKNSQIGSDSCIIISFFDNSGSRIISVGTIYFTKSAMIPI